MKKMALLALVLTVSGCTTETMQVYRSDGAQQCEGGGISLAQSKEELAGAGVKVVDSQCAVRTGISIMAMCGAPTLGIHLHEINADDLDKAQQLGFADAKGLVDTEQGVNFEVSACPE